MDGGAPASDPAIIEPSTVTQTGTRNAECVRVTEIDGYERLSHLGRVVAEDRVRIRLVEREAMVVTPSL